MPSTIQTKTQVTETMRKELQALFDQFLDKPFRRADLSERVMRLGRPRTRDNADRLADAILKEAARAGQIARHGHLHWVRVSMNPGSRQLRSGRLVPERQDKVTLTVDTRVPTKYVLVDLETGDIWEGSARGVWTRSSERARSEAARLIGAPAMEGT